MKRRNGRWSRGCTIPIPEERERNTVFVRPVVNIRVKINSVLWKGSSFALFIATAIQKTSPLEKNIACACTSRRFLARSLLRPHKKLSIMVSIEYSPNGRASCRGCHQKIDEGVVRVCAKGAPVSRSVRIVAWPKSLVWISVQTDSVCCLHAERLYQQILSCIVLHEQEGLHQAIRFLQSSEGRSKGTQDGAPPCIDALQRQPMLTLGRPHSVS